MIVIKVVRLMFCKRVSNKKLKLILNEFLHKWQWHCSGNNLNSWINDKRILAQYESVNLILKRAKKSHNSHGTQIIKHSTPSKSRSIDISYHNQFYFSYSNWLSSLWMGTLERMRCKVWNRHEITNTIDSESAGKRRQTLRIVDSKARLRRLQM